MKRLLMCATLASLGATLLPACVLESASSDSDATSGRIACACQAYTFVFRVVDGDGIDIEEATAAHATRDSTGLFTAEIFGTDAVLPVSAPGFETALITVTQPPKEECNCPDPQAIEVTGVERGAVVLDHVLATP